MILDHSATGNDAVLDDDNNAILDDKTLILSVGFPHAILVQDLDVAPNACILVDDALANVGVGACRRRHTVLSCSSMVLPAAGLQHPGQDMTMVLGLSCKDSRDQIKSCRLTQAHGQAARDEGALLQSLVVVRAHHLQGAHCETASCLQAGGSRAGSHQAMCQPLLVTEGQHCHSRF